MRPGQPLGPSLIEVRTPSGFACLGKKISGNVFEYENGHNSAPPGTYGAENLHAGISQHAGLDSDSPEAPNLAKTIIFHGFTFLLVY